MGFRSTARSRTWPGSAARAVPWTQSPTTLCSGQATSQGDRELNGRRRCASRPPRTSRVPGCADVPRPRRIPWLRDDFNERVGEVARGGRRAGMSRSPSMRSATSSTRSGTARPGRPFEVTASALTLRRVGRAAWRPSGRDLRRPSRVLSGHRLRAVAATGGGGGGTPKPPAVSAPT